MSQRLTINELQEKIPVLKDAHKKTPIQPRSRSLGTLLNLKILEAEPYFVDNILRNCNK